MARLIDSGEVKVSVEDGWMTFVDQTLLSDTYHLYEPEGSWLRAARGIVQLDCPSDVITVRARVESWSQAPPGDASSWTGSAEVDVELPGGESLCLDTLAESCDIPMALPSPGLYRLRAHWALNPETGPYYSPFEAGVVLETPAGREQALQDADLFCLVQLWRLADAPG